jgi:hypothetical protein
MNVGERGVSRILHICYFSLLHVPSQPHPTHRTISPIHSPCQYRNLYFLCVTEQLLPRDFTYLGTRPTLKLEEASSSDNSVNVDQMTQCHLSEDLILKITDNSQIGTSYIFIFDLM